MVEVKGKTIIYTVAGSEQLGQVSPYLFVERLAEQLVDTWPQLKVNKIFASKKQHSHQIHCVLPSNYANEQIKLIKSQIELIAASLLADLQDKINWAKMAV
ncbi:MAG: hypothetical protein HY819_10705 [Acidobacteria bacterium]|nr:hypothetical protein [Acidobacteriota bacterium]